MTKTWPTTLEMLHVDNSISKEQTYRTEKMYSLNLKMCFEIKLFIYMFASSANRISMK